MRNSKTKPKVSTRFYQTSQGIISRNKLLELEVKGVAQGLVWIVKNAPDKPKINTKLLLDLHKRCFSFIFPDWAGKIRRIEVKVSDYTPPSPHEIRQHLFNFERDLAEQLKHLSKDEKLLKKQIVKTAAWMQHKIVWIHPFLDYNGRIARLTTNLLLLEYGLPLVEIPAEKTGNVRDQYIQAMRKADKEDHSQLEELLWRALTDAV